MSTKTLHSTMTSPDPNAKSDPPVTADPRRLLDGLDLPRTAVNEFIWRAAEEEETICVRHQDHVRRYRDGSGTPAPPQEMRRHSIAISDAVVRVFDPVINALLEATLPASLFEVRYTKLVYRAEDLARRWWEMLVGRLTFVPYVHDGSRESFPSFRVRDILDQREPALKLEAARRYSQFTSSLPPATNTEPQKPVVSAAATSSDSELQQRADELRNRLRENGWSIADFRRRHGGPDPKTTRKILAGKPVRESTWEQVVEALSKKKRT